jgi:hypothetical protein
MWIVKDGEVGRNTPDAELPIMLFQRHVEFHDVGPTMGQYTNYPTNGFLSVPAVLWHYTNVDPTMAPPTVIIHTLGHRWSNVVNPTDQKMTLGQRCVAIWDITHSCPDCHLTIMQC